MAIGPIIRPYKGEKVDNEVVFELQTIPENCRYLGVGNTIVRVKTPEGEITHKLLLKPEGVWDEWVEEFEDLPELNDNLLRILAALKDRIEDKELKRATEEFLSRLIAHTETFKRELERLEGIAIKEPLWLVQVLKYKPSEQFGLDTLSWVEVSNFDYKREFLVYTEDRRIELSPIKGAELELFDALWRSLEKGFVARLVVTPEVFSFGFSVFGTTYFSLRKDFESGKVERELLSNHRVVKAMLKELEVPHFVEVSVFEDGKLVGELKKLREELKRLT